jgi:hypothetical protein
MGSHVTSPPLGLPEIVLDARLLAEFAAELDRQLHLLETDFGPVRTTELWPSNFWSRQKPKPR